MFVFKLKCMTAGAEEAEVKTQHVVVNCKHIIRPQVCLQRPVSNTCSQVFCCGYCTRSNVTFE